MVGRNSIWGFGGSGGASTDTVARALVAELTADLGETIGPGVEIYSSEGTWFKNNSNSNVILTGDTDAALLSDGLIELIIGNTFASRSAFVAWAALNTVPEGTVSYAGGQEYVAKTGATEISGLPGWVPKGTRTPIHHGMTSAGLVSDTAALQEAVDLGGDLYIPSGTFVVDQITITTKVHITMSFNTVLKQRSAPDGHTRIFLFSTGSDGSSVYGGVFDGDRATHETFYISRERAADYNTWEGIRSDGIDNVTIENVTFQNFVTMGLRRAGGNNHIWRNIRVLNCGEAIFAFGGVGHIIDSIYMKDIANLGTIIFQHAYELYELEGSSVTNIVLQDYAGDNLGFEPSSFGAVIVRCRNTSFSKMLFHSYKGNNTHFAASLNSNESCSFSQIHTWDYEAGVIGESNPDCVFSDLVLDGNYKNVLGNATNTRIGLDLTIGGTFDVNESSLAGETTANTTSRNTKVINAHITRFRIGDRIRSSNVHMVNVDCIGNEDDGHQVSEFNANTNPWIPIVRRNIRGVSFVNCSAVANGDSGFIAVDGADITVSNCRSYNNGQNTAGFFRSGIAFVANVGELSNVKAIYNISKDTQTWTVTDGISYEPVTATQAWIVVKEPDKVSVGQRINLVGATAGGDVIGKVIDRKADDLLVDFGASTTLIDQLTSIGTGSTLGNLLTIPGGIPASIYSPVFIKHPSNGEYRRITYENSTTEAVLSAAFSADIPAVTNIQAVLGDVSGIPSQTVNIRATADVVGPLTLIGNDTVGSVTLDNYILCPFESLSIPDSDASHKLKLATDSNLTADRTLKFDTGDASRKLTLGTDVALNQDLTTTASPTFSSGTFTAFVTFDGLSTAFRALGTTKNVYVTMLDGDFVITSSDATAGFRMLPSGNDIYFQNTVGAGNIHFTGPFAGAIAGNVVFNTSTAVRCSTNNQADLGTSAIKWKDIHTTDVHSVNAVIITSDMRKKEVDRRIDGVSASALVDGLDPVMFRWKGGDGSLKAGFLAQEIKSGIDTHDLDCSVWGLDDPGDPDSMQNMRPDQMIAFLWAALRETRNELKELKNSL